MENATIADDVKTSLASLEEVQVKSINSESLSSDEIQNAQRNLSDIILTAQSIKKNLHSNEESTHFDINDEGGSSADNEEIRGSDGQQALHTETLHPERRKSTVMGTYEAPKRRLSTPSCIPLQSSNVDIRVSVAAACPPI